VGKNDMQTNLRDRVRLTNSRNPKRGKRTNIQFAHKHSPDFSGTVLAVISNNIFIREIKLKQEAAWLIWKALKKYIGPS